MLSETLVELVNTSCCIHQLHLTFEEWMRLVRDLKLDQRILVA